MKNMVKKDKEFKDALTGVSDACERLFKVSIDIDELVARQAAESYQDWKSEVGLMLYFYNDERIGDPVVSVVDGTGDWAADISLSKLLQRGVSFVKDDKDFTPEQIDALRTAFAANLRKWADAVEAKKRLDR